MGRLEDDALWIDLLCSSSIDDYIERNRPKIHDVELRAHLNRLLEEKRYNRHQVIQEAQIDKVYGYQIFSGERKPSRDKLIQICFGMRLCIHDAQELLEIGGFMPLNPRILRDAIILFCLVKDKDVTRVDDELAKRNERPLQRT